MSCWLHVTSSRHDIPLKNFLGTEQIVLAITMAVLKERKINKGTNEQADS
jgi:hypothetical protein